MINKLNILLIRVLNSPYKIILNLLIYFIIYYSSTKANFSNVECMQGMRAPRHPTAEEIKEIAADLCSPYNRVEITSLRDNIPPFREIFEEQDAIIKNPISKGQQIREYVEWHENSDRVIRRQHQELMVARQQIAEAKKDKEMLVSLLEFNKNFIRNFDSLQTIAEAKCTKIASKCEVTETKVALLKCHGVGK